MRKLLITFSLFFSLASLAQKPKYVLVIHGGAGTILKSQMTVQKERAYTAALDTALMIGEKILAAGGTSLDAVEAAVKYMEDNPLFNAGRGAVFTADGKNELDAAIMDGKDKRAGSVAGVTTVRHPISAARAVMEKSPHVMMAGKGADEFAKAQGLEIVDPSWFHTAERYEGWKRLIIRDSLKSIDTARRTGLRDKSNHDDKYGTVGAVALDRHGNLAAATSTGGMTNKKFGRIGDAPIIGAGTYANNATAALSGTGWGEFYIRLVLAKAVSDRMEFGKISLREAADEMIMKQLPALGGDGGLIAVDKYGNIAMPFCTEGMYRGYVKEGDNRVVKIYKESNSK